MLLGRESECEAIDRLLDAARDSRSGVLVLRGDAGIGKTALLEHALAHADGMRVLTGAGVEAESELPFAGLHQLLWPILDRAGELPDVQSAALRGAFGLSAERVEDRFLVSVAVWACSPRPPTRSRCCASSTTRTGSTARRPRRSCSSRGGCRPIRSPCSSARARATHGSSMRMGCPS